MGPGSAAFASTPRRHYLLPLAALLLCLGLSPAAFSQTCPAGTAPATFAWSTSPGTGNEWLAGNQSTGDSQTYTVTYTDSYGNTNSVDVILTLQDPDGRNCDANFVTDPLWPNDPDCTTNFSFTETNGTYGSGFLTIHMKSITSSEEISFDFSFSKPVIMDEFTVSDIDDVGYDFQPTVEPGDSYQDQVSLLASLGGVGVPLSLAGGSNISISGQTATAIVVAGVSGNVAPTDPVATLTVSAAQLLDTLSLTYRNGPDDAAAEPANSGVSDSHLIRVSGFEFCVEDEAPALTINKTSAPAGPVAPGDTITYTVEVANAGPGAANDIAVSDSLPAGVAYVAASAQKTYPTDSSGSFTSPNLGPATFDTGGLVQSFDTTGQIPAGATLLTYGFTVSGTSADWLSDIALVAAYPGGTAYTLGAGTFGGDGAGSFNETRGPGSFGGSAEGNYQFSWSDGFDGVAGDDNTASSTVFTITYDAGRTTVTDAAGAPPDLVTAAEGLRLEPGETMTLTFQVTVDDPLPGGVTDLVNTAQVTAIGLGPFSDDATNTVDADADVSVVKSLLTPGPYQVGQTVTYQLLVSNAGPADATNVVVYDAPTHLTLDAVSGGGCTALPCTIPSLAAGASVTITVTATVQ